MGFIAVPRTCGRQPSQRLRPALPSTMFMWSALPIAPIVARHAAGTRRISPLGRLIWAQPASRAASVALGPGRAAKRRPAARLHLDAVDAHAQRDRRQRQAVADRRRGVRPAHQLVARLQPVGGEDVSLLAVGVVQQGDPRRAVGIVLDRVDHRRDAVLVAAEIDQAVVPLVAAAAMPGGDHALVVPPALAVLADQQALGRLGARASARRNRSRWPRGGPAWSDCIGEYPCTFGFSSASASAGQRRADLA